LTSQPNLAVHRILYPAEEFVKAGIEVRLIVLVLVVDDEPDVEACSASNSGATCVRNASSWTLPFQQADALSRIADH